MTFRYRMPFGARQPSARRIARGTEIFQVGVSAGHAWEVVSGTVRLRRHDDDGAVATWLACSGDIIGADAMLTGRHGVSATALTQCQLRPWGVEQVDRRALLHALLRSEHRIASVVGLRSGSARERVLHLVRMLGAPPVEMPTLQDIGDITDLNLSTVSRTITSLVAAQALRLEGRQRSHWVVPVDDAVALPQGAGIGQPIRAVSAAH